MNLLKSIFISMYLMLVMGVGAYAGWNLYQGGDPMAWSGVLLTTAPILGVISRLMSFKNIARTSAHFPLINLLGAVGVGLTIWAWTTGSTAMAALELALVSWLGFLLYAYWFSTFGGRSPSARLQVGAKLPHFTVKNTSGVMVSVAQLTDRPAVFMFFRGNWCPLCMAQVKELVARYRDLESLNIRVALISPQPHENTIGLARKFQVNFDFLTDTDNAAARALGIENVNGTPLGMQTFGYANDTVLPTVIITDHEGKVVWAHETDNYRIRPEPDTFIEVLRRHQVVAHPA